MDEIALRIVMSEVGVAAGENSRRHLCTYCEMCKFCASYKKKEENS